MMAHVSLYINVDSPEPLLPAYIKYRCRPELRKLAPLSMVNKCWLLPICEYQNLTCWSNLYLGTLYITLNKISNYCFHLNAIIFILLQLSKNKSEIWFQYLVYYIIHTCNTYDNRYRWFRISRYLHVYKSSQSEWQSRPNAFKPFIHCNISDIYDIFFIVKEIQFFLEIIEEKDPWKPDIQNHVYFVNIACKFIMVYLYKINLILTFMHE